MKVDKVRDATTPNSAVHYELTLRVWHDDLDKSGSDEKLGDLVRRAVNGIATYPIRKFGE